MPVDGGSGASIRIPPDAAVLPANVLRFYVHFPRPAEAHFDRSGLRLLDDGDREVPGLFLVLSQELWSADGRRLTVLMEPGRLKRGLGVDAAHVPALAVGRRHSLVVAAMGLSARHAFLVGEPVLEPLDEARLRVIPPRAGGRNAVVVRFDRVVGAALCEDEIRVLAPTGRLLPTRAHLRAGTVLRLVPEQPWAAGQHRILLSDRFEDVCGNRLGEALDHDLGQTGRPLGGLVVLAVE